MDATDVGQGTPGASATVPTQADGTGAEVAGVRERRSDLHTVLVELEAAIAAPVPGRPQDWVAGVRTVLQRLQQAFAGHVVGTEGPEGLFGKVMLRSPRLAHQCRRLEQEHVAIVAATTHALRLLDEHPDQVRDAVMSLLAKLARHRQRGADLVYEAYAVDLGGGD